MQKILDLIPLTVFIALFLFILREILDLTKKRRDERRKLEVYKELICEELRVNFFALDQLVSICERIIKIHSEGEHSSIMEVNTDRYGNDYIKLHHGSSEDRKIMDMRLSKFSTKHFENHLSDLLLLDRETYKEINALYKDIRFYDTVRNNIVCFLAKEINDVRSYFIGSNLNQIVSQKEWMFDDLQHFHKKLTGATIKIHMGEAISVQ